MNLASAQHIASPHRNSFPIVGSSSCQDTGSLVASTFQEISPGEVLTICGAELLVGVAGGLFTPMQGPVANAAHGCQYANYSVTLTGATGSSITSANQAISSQCATFSFDQFAVISTTVVSTGQFAQANSLYASIEELCNTVRVISEGGPLSSTPEFEKLLARTVASRGREEDINQWAISLAGYVGDLND